MDQLRKVLGWLKRQHFWVLCAVVAVLALGCWYRAAGALQSEFAQNEATIKQEFSAQSTRRSEEFHANEGINERQREENEKQRKDVEDIWQRLYDRQRDEVLKWPKELSAKFRTFVAGLKFGDNIPVDLRNNYMNYVGGHFKELPKIVGAREYAEGEGGGSGRRGGYGGYEGRGGRGPEIIGGAGQDEPVEDEDYIVEWMDQDKVRAELYMPQTPSPMRIWVTQENLWVYHTLLTIIARTNEAAGADRNSNAAVRVIESLDVGQPAGQTSRSTGRITLLAPPVAGGAEGEDGGGYPAAAPEDMAGGRGGFEESAGGEYGGRGGMPGGAESEATEQAALLTGRYLDAEGTPVAVAEGEPAPGRGAEMKRLPVRMRLIMDQRWLTHLISECANAPLQVEVQEVRINVQDDAGGGRGGYSDRGGGFEMPGMLNRDGEAMVFPREPNVVPVVIQGIIYIFNEPDPAVLQVDGMETGV